jgi:hypothetical protein
MARLNKQVVNEREDYVMALFGQGIGVRQANEKLFELYGKRMGFKRIYELRDMTRANTQKTQEVAQPEEVIENAIT